MMRVSANWRRAAIFVLWQSAFWGGLIALQALPSALLEGVRFYLPLVVIVASTTLAIVALGLLPLTRFDRRQWSGAALLLLIAADAAFTAYSGQNARVLRYAVQYLAILSSIAFVAELAGAGGRTTGILAGLFFAILGVLVLANWSGQLAHMVGWLDPAAVSLTALYLLVALPAMPERDIANRIGAVLSIGIAAMAYDIAINLGYLPAGTVQATTIFPLYLVIAVALELATYGFSIHRAARDLKSELTSKISFQETELSEAAMRLREQERLVAISLERQRLVRDMHDGAGGLLTRLLLRLRNGNVPLDEVREGIQAAVDDLRHIIDSMDCADEGLDIALAIFRERIAPRLASEAITLQWTDQAPRPLPDIGSQRMIQICRILQEGITNTLRHSGARRIEMHLTPDGLEGRLVLSMADDGIGFALGSEADRPRWQRGLTNMARRARMIGGELTIVTALGAGTRLNLLLPL